MLADIMRCPLCIELNQTLNSVQWSIKMVYSGIVRGWFGIKLGLGSGRGHFNILNVSSTEYTSLRQ